MEVDHVFLDTSFFIRLFKTGDPDHQHARAYYRRLREKGATFFLSTIVVAEFGVKGDLSKLPYPEVKLLPFNLSHARLAADFARTAFDARRKGAIDLGKRVVIPNDSKLMAQAQVENVDLIIARDDNFQKVYNFFKEEGLITSDFLDLRTPPTEFFGELFS